MIEAVHVAHTLLGGPCRNNGKREAWKPQLVASRNQSYPTSTNYSLYQSMSQKLFMLADPRLNVLFLLYAYRRMQLSGRDQFEKFEWPASPAISLPMIDAYPEPCL